MKVIMLLMERYEKPFCSYRIYVAYLVFFWVILVYLVTYRYNKSGITFFFLFLYNSEIVNNKYRHYHTKIKKFGSVLLGRKAKGQLKKNCEDVL